MCANLWWYAIPETCLPWHAGRWVRLVRFYRPGATSYARRQGVVRPPAAERAAGGLEVLGEDDHPVAVGVVVRDRGRLGVPVLQVEPPGRLVVRCGRGLDQQQPAALVADVLLDELQQLPA